MNIEKQVLQIIASALRLSPDQIRPEAHLKEDLGASSLDRYTIVVDVEDAFGITLDDVPEDELEQKFSTVSDIIAFLSERLADRITEPLNRITEPLNRITEPLKG